MAVTGGVQTATSPRKQISRPASLRVWWPATRTGNFSRGDAEIAEKILGSFGPPNLTHSASSLRAVRAPRDTSSGTCCPRYARPSGLPCGQAVSLCSAIPRAEQVLRSLGGTRG